MVCGKSFTCKSHMMKIWEVIVVGVVVSLLSVNVCAYQSSLLPKNRNFCKMNSLNVDEWTPPAPLPDNYEFIPPEVGPEIYLGSIISMIPIIWASVEFNARIQTQRRCKLCNGSGLVYVTQSGNTLKRPRKCGLCGGFLPWLGEMLNFCFWVK